MVAVSGEESGKPCYVICGDSLKYEPAFISNPTERQEVQAYNANSSKVSLAGGKFEYNILIVRKTFNGVMPSDQASELAFKRKKSQHQRN